MRTRFQILLVACLAVLPMACGPPHDHAGSPADETPSRPDAAAERVLAEAFHQITAAAHAMDSLLRPVPLLTAAQEAALQQYPNEQQLEQARRLGIPLPASASDLERLQREGRLVRLEERTAYWTVRELEHSAPLVTPDVRALLTEIGTRFQARLRTLGLPPLRLEVTSALRTAESQEELRATNRNATSGTSTHEFGTTIDIAYSSFRAPEQPGSTVEVPEARWLEPYLHRFEEAMTEAVAARRSRELQAILGHVLREMQAEGKVMVTLERQQPVYHMTVARRY